MAALLKIVWPCRVGAKSGLLPVFCKSIFTGTQPHSFIYIQSMAAPVIQGWVVATETAWPARPKILLFGPYRKCVSALNPKQSKDPKQHKFPSVRDRLNKLKDLYSRINFHIINYYEALKKKEAYVHPEVWNSWRYVKCKRLCTNTVPQCVCLCVYYTQYYSKWNLFFFATPVPTATFPLIPTFEMQ